MSGLKTLTLASIYEFQGHKEDALEIYKEILKKEPQNKEAIAAVRRLSGIHKKYSSVNIQMRDFFLSMKTEIEYREFERWLSRLWN
jgi:tetratricopeptide (TPR) repeat protein